MTGTIPTAYTNGVIVELGFGRVIPENTETKCTRADRRRARFPRSASREDCRDCHRFRAATTTQRMLVIRREEVKRVTLRQNGRRLNITQRGRWIYIPVGSQGGVDQAGRESRSSFCLV